jgi:uncharacterized protein YkuJ
MIFQHRDAGFEFVKRLFEKNGLRVLSTSFYNKRRDMLLNLRDDRDVESFVYVLFKKQPIHSFNHLKETQRFLSDHPDMLGQGESINVDCLDYANSRGVRLVFYVYEDAKVYYVPLSKIRGFAPIRIQDRENEYKTLQDGSVMLQIIREKEYIFPLKWLERYE